MPRYYFHLHDDMDVPDEVGTELSDIEAAREYAAVNALDLMCGVLKSNRRVTLSHRIDIEDEQQRVLETIRFGDLVRIED